MISKTSAKTEEFRDKILLSRIEKHGWAKIICPAASDSPAFAFTVGLFQKWKHPEIIVFGLEFGDLKDCIDSIVSRITEGEVFKHLKMDEGILSVPLHLHRCRF